MNDLISVIIPVYNVEKYLDRCIESVVNQTYSKLEILLIDDGATDNSGKLCDEWTKKDNRIQVIHKKNGGVSSARNLGLEEAKGKYITFIDSDDYVSKNYIEKLYCLMDDDTQIVRVIKNGNGKIEIYSKEFFEIFEEIGKFNTSWNQIIRKKLLTDNQIRFNEKIRFGEDLLFSMDAIIAAKSLKLVDFNGYQYGDNGQSITRVMDKNIKMKNIYELSIVYTSIYHKFNGEIEDFRTNQFFEEVNRYLLQMFANCSISYEEFSLLMNKIYENLNDIMFKKFDKNKPYQGFKKIYINCLLKKKMKLYYYLITIRKKMKGRKNG